MYANDIASCYNALMATKTKKPAKKAKPGPKAETLKLEGDWKANIAKSFQTARVAPRRPK